MKKDYMKPEGKVVALRMNENISVSGVPGANDAFGIHYTITDDGVKYIYTSTEWTASSTGDEKYDLFYDLIISYLHNIDPNCRFDPNAE